MLEEEHVPTAFNLREVRQEGNADCIAWRHRHRDNFGKSIGSNIGGDVGNNRAPVVTDDDRIRATPKCIAQSEGIHGRGSSLKAAVRGNLSWGVSTQERSDSAKTSIGESRKQMTPGMGRIGESM